MGSVDGLNTYNCYYTVDHLLGLIYTTIQYSNPSQNI